jgi:DAACS family dicarboxylate/amino acid:cation (Na+ or H+) symporter
MKGWIKITVALCSGVLFGLITQQEFQLLTVVGKMFIDLLKMLVGILVFSSIVTGICHVNDPKKLGRIGIRAISFFFVTTLISIIIGICLAQLLQPGVDLHCVADVAKKNSLPSVGIFEFCASLIPANPFVSFVEGNILQVIVFAILFSLGIIVSGEKGKPLILLFESLSEVLHGLTQIIMKFTPYGVFALIASSVGAMGVKLILPLLQFLACCYLGCLIQLFVVFSFILKCVIKTPVIPFFKGLKDAMIVAFTTCSSSATLPITMECTTKELRVSKEISSFVLALGSTVNMNGASIGQAVSAMFIAQAYGIELSWLNIGVLIFTSIFTSIGAAGIPGTGILMLSVVLTSVGLPLEGILLVAGVDRIREMLSTVVNIVGDGLAAVYVAKAEERYLRKKVFVSV